MYYKCEQCNNKNVFVRGKFCEDQFFVKFVTTTIYLGTTKNYVYLLFPYEISYKRMLYYIIITKILPHRNILVCQYCTSLFHFLVLYQFLLHYVIDNPWFQYEKYLREISWQFWIVSIRSHISTVSHAE